MTESTHENMELESFIQKADLLGVEIDKLKNEGVYFDLQDINVENSEKSIENYTTLHFFHRGSDVFIPLASLEGGSGNIMYEVHQEWAKGSSFMKTEKILMSVRNGWDYKVFDSKWSELNFDNRTTTIWVVY